MAATAAVRTIAAAHGMRRGAGEVTGDGGAAIVLADRSGIDVTVATTVPYSNQKFGAGRLSVLAKNLAANE
jgi:hypothetical protein